MWTYPPNGINDIEVFLGKRLVVNDALIVKHSIAEKTSCIEAAVHLLSTLHVGWRVGKCLPYEGVGIITPEMTVSTAEQGRPKPEIKARHNSARQDRFASLLNALFNPVYLLALSRLQEARSRVPIRASVDAGECGMNAVAQGRLKGAEAVIKRLGEFAIP